jgi:hypothetical protein
MVWRLFFGGMTFAGFILQVWDLLTIVRLKREKNRRSLKVKSGD